MTDESAPPLSPDEDRRLWRPDGPLRWLVSHGARYPETAALMQALCARLVAEGVPLLRASWAIRTIHPQVRGATYLWRRGGADVMETLRLHSITDDPAYIDSPFRTLFETGQPLRRNLAAGETDFPLLKEIRAEGGTDYLALPMTFEGGWINALAWTTDRPDGLSVSEVNLFKALCPVLSQLLQIRVQQRVTRTLLATYLGRHASDSLLAGRVRRGDGEIIRAVLWASDIKGFTEMAEAAPPAEVVSALNDFFECMINAVQGHGGDVLKFVGDGMLAIFPIEGEGRRGATCAQAVDATRQALAGMAAVNRARTGAGSRALDFGIGLHVGEVMLGNIGGPNRLDFTTVGAAVNQVARLENLSHALGHKAVVSKAFAEYCGLPCRSLGRHELRGIAAPQEVFALDPASVESAAG